MVEIIPAFSPEANLKRRVRAHLRNLGFKKNSKGQLVPPSTTKDTIRSLHRVQRRERVQAQREFVKSRLSTLRTNFASGTEVDPAKIAPRLELIKAGTWQSELFRLATLSWSVPVSAGFGRRLRYLVWDKSNEKLLGVIALGDPVFNLKARDDLIGWSIEDRSSRLVDVMDAYVLGAIPPYSQLLGGKLVSCLVRTREIRDDFKTKYSNARGIISGQKKHPQLVLVTTSSSLGRSSVYNRLKIDGQPYFSPVGFTGGWGHFHVPDSLFKDLRAYLRDSGHSYVDGHKFGEGPNWRLRTIRVALDALGFDGDLLRHGIKREVFASWIATNSIKVLRGQSKTARYRGLKSVDQVGELARERWVIPRAARMPDYRTWDISQFESLLSIRRPKRSFGNGAINASTSRR